MNMYFDYASLGIPDKGALWEVTEFLGQLPANILEEGGDYTLAFVSIIERTRELIANVYEVPSSNIAFIANTTEGLGLIASSIRNSKLGIKVVVPDIEFMSSALVWQNNSDSLTYCKTENGKVLVEKVDKLLDENNILCISSVQEVSGDRFPFQKLLKLREKRVDEFWIVDGIQEAGVFRRNLKEEQIDAYIVGGHKWLQSPVGIGFMYVSDRLLDKIRPNFYGYFNLEEPNEGWTHYLESRTRRLDDLKHLHKREGAIVFESGGMVNVVGALMLEKNIIDWCTFGFNKAKEHVIRLQHIFRDGLNSNKNIIFLGGKTEDSWSSFITLTSTNGIDSERKLFQYLSIVGIKASIRSINGIGGIRIGFHYMTTKKEVERLIKLINEFGSS